MSPTDIAEVSNIISSPADKDDRPNNISVQILKNKSYSAN